MHLRLSVLVPVHSNSMIGSTWYTYGFNLSLDDKFLSLSESSSKIFKKLLEYTIQNHWRESGKINKETITKEESGAFCQEVVQLAMDTIAFKSDSEISFLETRIVEAVQAEKERRKQRDEAYQKRHPIKLDERHSNEMHKESATRTSFKI